MRLKRSLKTTKRIFNEEGRGNHKRNFINCCSGRCRVSSESDCLVLCAALSDGETVDGSTIQKLDDFPMEDISTRKVFSFHWSFWKAVGGWMRMSSRWDVLVFESLSFGVKCFSKVQSNNNSEDSDVVSRSGISAIVWKTKRKILEKRISARIEAENFLKA